MASSASRSTSPDLGNAKNATQFARALHLPVAAGSKQRLADDKVVIDAIVGNVRGKNVIILDDEIATGGSILELVRKLEELDVRRMSLACTHGLFTGKAIERLGSCGFVEIVTTNTVPIAPEKRLPNMTVLSIAPLLAEAIHRIHEGESVSSLFVNSF
jgi:ribose-phosphate pyrophosphokinase